MNEISEIIELSENLCHSMDSYISKMMKLQKEISSPIEEMSWEIFKLKNEITNLLVV